MAKLYNTYWDYVEDFIVEEVAPLFPVPLKLQPRDYHFRGNSQHIEITLEDGTNYRWDIEHVFAAHYSDGPKEYARHICDYIRGRLYMDGLLGQKRQGKTTSGGTFCSCPDPILVMSSTSICAPTEGFEYCRKCGKERR